MCKLLTILEVTDSTSSEVMRRLESGESPPFSVAAYSQTNGRGRRGRTWSGEKGHFFLSLALPVSDVERLPTLSLEVASIVANWLQDTFHFKPTLKWPNDLLHGGRKLGGILCESAVSGDQIKHMVVGIGLNLIPAAELADLDAVSIREISGETFDLNQLYLDLSHRIFHSIPGSIADSNADSNLAPKDVLKDFFRFGTTGSVWEKDGELFLEQFLTQDGALVLKNINSHENELLFSSHHEFKWWLQVHGKSPLLIGDLGNSRLKLAAVSEQGVVGLGSYSSVQSLKQNFPDLEGHSLLFLAAVGKDKVREFSEAFSEGNIPCIEVPKRTIFVDLAAYDLNQMGIDRLAFMEGYLAGLPIGSRVAHHIGVLVSLGTATTIDCVQGDGKYLGGSILPGLQMGLHALAEETALLPKIQLAEWASQLPRWRASSRTEQALLSGVRLSVSGILAQVIKDLSEEFPQAQLKVLLTGGGAHLFQEYERDEFMILKGIRAMALG